MSKKDLRKIISILTSLSIAALAIMFVVCIAHLVSIPSADATQTIGDYFLLVLVPAIISVVFVVGGLIFDHFVKFDEKDNVSGRSKLEKFMASKKMPSVGKKSGAKAIDVIKRRDVIDLIACIVTCSCFVFIIDYVFLIANFSDGSVSESVTSVFKTALLIGILGLAVYYVRDYYSEKMSEDALYILETSARAAEGENAGIVTMMERDIKKVASTQKVMQIIGKALLYLFLGVMALIVVFPFYWMIISSLKTVPEYELPVPTLFPQEILWSNYSEAIKVANLFGLFKNTVIVGVVSTLLSLVITVITAFVFARLEFKGRDALFALLLATMMIPGELFTITNYVTVTKWGWVGSGISPLQGYSVLIVPFLVSIFYIYLLRQNFMQIPNELYLAAKVDGTKDLKYLWKVMIPLALPTLISITILKMMGAWNSYVWPRLVANENYYLITNGLRTAFKDANTNTSNIPQQMAAVTMVSIPLFLVFIFLRKYIMKGVSRSGIKG